MRHVLTILLNFVRQRTPESSTRLCAILCCATGCGCSVAVVMFAFHHPDKASTITALVGLISALISAGAVALLTRTKDGPDTSLSGSQP